MAVARFGALAAHATVLLGGWILTILAAFVARHLSPSNSVPAFVNMTSLLAAAGGAILPSGEQMAPGGWIAAAAPP